MTDGNQHGPISNQNPPFQLRPGRVRAVQMGCTCTPGQNPARFRDGWGWDISSDCPLHSSWGELAE